MFSDFLCLPQGLLPGEYSAGASGFMERGRWKQCLLSRVSFMIGLNVQIRACDSIMWPGYSPLVDGPLGDQSKQGLHKSPTFPCIADGGASGRGGREGVLKAHPGPQTGLVSALSASMTSPLLQSISRTSIGVFCCCFRMKKRAWHKVGMWKIFMTQPALCSVNSFMQKVGNSFWKPSHMVKALAFCLLLFRERRGSQ